MAMLVMGGYGAFEGLLYLFRTPTPVFVTFNGQGVEPGGQTSLWHPSLKNKKLKKPKDPAELVMKPDLKENPLMKLTGVNAGEAETFLNQTGGANLASVTKKTALNPSGGRAGGASMMVAGARTGSKGSLGSAQIGAMSSSKVSLATTPGIRTGAPDATEGTNSGGDPGGDPTKPPIPVGDGFYILLILVAGYTFVHRKRINGNKYACLPPNPPTRNVPDR